MHAVTPNKDKGNKSKQTLAFILAFSGTLPFFAALANGFFRLLPFDNAYFALSYGAVIIAFLSGSIWMLALISHARFSLLMMIASNIVALLAWGCLLMSFVHAAFVLEMMGFTLLYYLDVRAAKQGIIPQWYLNLRGRVSIVVMVLLLLLVMV